jgi:hypothetical protein
MVCLVTEPYQKLVLGTSRLEHDSRHSGYASSHFDLRRSQPFVLLGQKHCLVDTRKTRKVHLQGIWTTILADVGRRHGEWGL